jgi:diguanylate cyclase (GGDEF)-like protein
MTSDGQSTLRQLHSALEAAGDLAYIWDLASDALEWHGSTMTRLGGSHAAAIVTGKGFAERIHPEDRSLRESRLEASAARGDFFECEYRLGDESGDTLWVQDRGRAELAADGSPQRLMGVLRLVTDRKLEQLRLERLANHDELTGHFNRTRLREALNRAVSSSLRSGRPGAYLAIGIDKLGTVNDAFGYQIADEVIVEIGRRLDRQFRGGDVMGRVGGDRFGLVLSSCPPENVATVAEKILALIGQAQITTSAGALYATVSIGGVCFPEHGMNGFDVMTRAETALAEAKRAGRDCFVAYRVAKAQQRQQRADIALGERVQRALKEDRLVFAYQPVVNSESGAVAYHECLLRMIAEDGSIVSAAAFVSVIEQLGFIRLLDRYVLERAVSEASQHPECALAFNISGLTATDHAWLRFLVSLLRDRPEVARQLVIEITETAALHDIQESARFVGTLRELGCRVALDDFGAGFTSFRYMQALDVDIVKIDGSFVRNLAESSDNQIFLRHLVGLADAFGLITVAECVESARDAAILRQEGVRFLQGYYFGRPTLEQPWRAVQKAVTPQAARRRSIAAS